MQSSSYGWPVLHDALVERFILRITRLSDPAESLKSKEKTNLSFTYLIGLLEDGRHAGWLEELKADLDSFKVQIGPLKDLRDKVLAHTDEAIAMRKRQYPVVSISTMNKLIPRISDFCQKVRTHFDLVHFHYDWCVGAWVGGITASFRKLERFEEICDRVHNGEPLDVYQLRQAILKAGREQA